MPGPEGGLFGRVGCMGLRGCAGVDGCEGANGGCGATFIEGCPGILIDGCPGIFIEGCPGILIEGCAGIVDGSPMPPNGSCMGVFMGICMFWLKAGRLPNEDGIGIGVGV